MSQEERYVTKVELARQLNRSRSQITRYCQAGLPQASDGSIPLRQAREWLRENYSTHASDADGNTLAAKKSEKLSWEIERVRLEVEQQKENLIDKERAERLTFDLANQFKDALQSWPARAAPEIAAATNTDPATMQRVLDRHVRRLLQQCADDLRRFQDRGA
mgnify:CR=1 FL=1